MVRTVWAATPRTESALTQTSTPSAGQSKSWPTSEIASTKSHNSGSDPWRNSGRYLLAVILAEDHQCLTFVVTARDMTKDEKRIYRPLEQLAAQLRAS